MARISRRLHGFATQGIWTRTRGNDRACRFYERLGFAPDGARRTNDRFLATPFEELRYRKAITAPSR